MPLSAQAFLITSVGPVPMYNPGRVSIHSRTNRSERIVRGDGFLLIVRVLPIVQDTGLVPDSQSLTDLLCRIGFVEFEFMVQVQDSLSSILRDRKRLLSF